MGKAPSTPGQRRPQTPFPAWMLASKTEPEAQLVSMIDRPRLVQRLKEGRQRKLTLVWAAAGYGKTSLLSSWRTELLAQGVKVAWLSLDGDDNAPGVLAAYLAFSLHSMGLTSAIDDLSATDFGPRLDPRSVVGMLAAALAMREERFVLMMDGLESLNAESAKTVIEPMLRHFPRNVHVVLSGRTSGLLPLCDYRLSGALAELSAEDLKFTFAEMTAFLEPLLDKTQLKQAAKVSRGWPVALRFMKIALANSPDRKALLHRFHGTQPAFRDYFSEHILNCVPEPQQSFLIEASILDRIDWESADHIRNHTDSQLLLNAIDGLRGLLDPEDNDERTFLLHPLLREFLRHHLKLHDLEKYRSLHRQAATWAVQNGQVIRAMRFALEADEKDAAAEIIESAGGLMRWEQEGMARIRAAHSLLPNDVVEKRPRSHLIRALIHLKDGNLTDAKRILENVRNHAAASTDTRLKFELTVLSSTLSFYEGSDPAAYIPELEATLTEIQDRQYIEKSFSYTALCVSRLQYGRLKEARKAAHLGMSGGNAFGNAYLHLHLGAISFAEGHLREAIADYRKAQAIIRRDFNDDKDMKLVANVLIAEWHYERNDLARARKLLGDANARLVHGEAWYEIYAAGYTTSSSIAFRLHGLEAAAKETEGALEYVEREALNKVRGLLVANACGYLTRSGEIARARTLVQESGLSLDDYKNPSFGSSPIRERLGIVTSLCRLLLAEKRYRKAIDELTGFIEIEQGQDHNRATLKLSLLLALALYLAKGRRRSFAMLNDVLARVRRQGFVRLVLDESPFVEELLAAYAKSRNATERDHAQHLLRLLRHADTDREVTKLSNRENQVLEELSKGLPDKAIARNLKVTENTVRFHLRNIFRKLGVNSRLQAATQAKARFDSMPSADASSA